jgi:hypothetical protein
MRYRRTRLKVCCAGALPCLTAVLLLTERGLAQDIGRFPPDPLCTPRMALSPALDSSSLAAGRGGLFVRLESWKDTAALESGKAMLFPLDYRQVVQRDSQPTDSSRLGRPRDSGGLYPFTNREAGRYLMTARRIGYAAARDTVVIRAGGNDTLVIVMEPIFDDVGNVHNCRPHHFRAPGEPACLTDTILMRNTRSVALHFAKSPSERKLFKLPEFTPADVAVIHDTAICERAAVAYGAGTHDPPRCVVVVRAGPIYFVFDPLEPLRAGEFEIWMVLDRHFHELAGIAD